MKLTERVEALRSDPAGPVTLAPRPVRPAAAGAAGAGAGTAAATPGRPPSAPAPATAPVLAGPPAASHPLPTEAVVDPLSELKERVAQALFERIGARLNDPNLSEEQLHSYARAELGSIVADEQMPLNSEEQARLIVEIAADVLGYGPLEALLADDDVTEIMVNGPEQIFLERRGRLVESGSHFTSEAQLRRVIERIVSKVGRRIDESSPLVDARLADGSRVNAIIPPLAVDGSSLTIRKFSRQALTASDLVALGTMSPQLADVLHACVEAKLNIIVSGGTGTGKTTLLNVLSGYIPGDERIITIEDAVELQLQQQHVIRLESRPPNTEGKGEVTIRDLVRNSLRMRPDRIVIGECRGGESLDMLQAMNTGHEGSISTVHANSPRDAIARLETLVLMAGMDLPLRAIREQIASAIDVIVQITRLKDGSRRITHVTEVQGMEGDIVTMQDAFVFDHRGPADADGRMLGHAVATGVRPRFADRFVELGLPLSPQVFQADLATRGAR